MRYLRSRPTRCLARVIFGFEQTGNQTFVAGPEAYSSNETRAGLPKFGITHSNTQRRPYQWKLWITNLETERDAWVNAPTVNFTPVCP